MPGTPKYARWLPKELKRRKAARKTARDAALRKKAAPLLKVARAEEAKKWAPLQKAFDEKQAQGTKTMYKVRGLELKLHNLEAKLRISEGLRADAEAKAKASEAKAKASEAKAAASEKDRKAEEKTRQAAELKWCRLQVHCVVGYLGTTESSMHKYATHGSDIMCIPSDSTG